MWSVSKNDVGKNIFSKKDLSNMILICCMFLRFIGMLSIQKCVCFCNYLDVVKMFDEIGSFV